MPAKRNQEAVLITGSAGRIGKAIALSLARSGYAIALHYKNSTQAATQTAVEIRRHGVRCEIFPCDLSNEYEVKELIPAVLKKLPKLKLLINSASIFERSSLVPLDLKNLDKHLMVNLKAPYILTSVFAERCKKGHIINILDTNVVKNKTAHMAYLLSKKSLRDLTKLAALQTRLLDHAATLVKPGGTLVYCTCSLEPEECEQAVEALLGRNPGLRRHPIGADEVAGLAELLTPEGDLRTLPCHLPDPDPRMAGLDGFYSARIIRNQGP